MEIVIGETQAHYVGRWDYNISLQELRNKALGEPIVQPVQNGGLFYFIFDKFYTESKFAYPFKFTASTFDFFGKAKCKGVITPEIFQFEKNYNSDATGSIYPIFYKGIRKRIEYPNKIDEFVAGILNGEDVPPRHFAMVRTSALSPLDFLDNF